MSALKSGDRQVQGGTLSEADRRMLDFAVRLAREPRSVTKEDIDALRIAGFSDTAIHDIVQITGFFSYYNRLTDGLGIDPEPAPHSPNPLSPDPSLPPSPGERGL